MTHQGQYAEELEVELGNILKYWMEIAPDRNGGGFFGRINNSNVVDMSAPKGAVLNARILWSFSAAYRLQNNVAYLNYANKAYDYFIHHFADNNYGGVYWTVDAEGNPLDTKKQVYAIAFAIYALCEYFMASGQESAKQHAVEMYMDLIRYSYDADQGGFLEAFNQQWQAMDDLRLSDKDANEKKTMNTHLHILEAFTNLYRIWPEATLHQHIAELLNMFTRHIINPQTGHLTLFFDENWKVRSHDISYGHDIEASWLLLEAAEVIGDLGWIEAMQKNALKLAEASLEGVDADGAMWYEMNDAKNHLGREKHWWVQAEAMVGFFNAWQLSANENFLNASLKTWGFVKTKLLDPVYGEWFWGLDEAGFVMNNQDKAGLWKCPYHNSRACIELMKRIS